MFESHLLNLVPPAFRSFAHVQESTTIGGLAWPVIQPGFCVDERGKMMTDEIRAAVRNGVGLSIGAEFDLRSLEEDVVHLRSLNCGLGEPPLGWSAVERMESLEGLQTPSKGDPVDLSRLPKLRELWAFSEAYFSGAAAPQVESAYLSARGKFALETVSPALSSLGLVGSAASFEIVKKLPLRSIGFGLDRLDLQPLIGHPTLRSIQIDRCRDLRTAGAVLRIPSLREVRFVGVRRVDDPEALRLLDVPDVHLEDCVGVEDRKTGAYAV